MVNSLIEDRDFGVTRSYIHTEQTEKYAWPRGRTRKHCCGNIVAETLCFLLMFSCLPTSGNIVTEIKFASQAAKMFPNKFRNIFCCGNNVS